MCTCTCMCVSACEGECAYVSLRTCVCMCTCVCICVYRQEGQRQVAACCIGPVVLFAVAVTNRHTQLPPPHHPDADLRHRTPHTTHHFPLTDYRTHPRSLTRSLTRSLSLSLSLMVAHVPHPLTCPLFLASSVAANSSALFPLSPFPISSLLVLIEPLPTYTYPLPWKMRSLPTRERKGSFIYIGKNKSINQSINQSINIHRKTPFVRAGLAHVTFYI